MKKLMAMLCALVLVCCAAGALADKVVKPAASETLKALIGGKSFQAAITGCKVTGEDEDAKFTLTVTVCERDRFDAALIDSLEVHDVLWFGNGTGLSVMELERDEYGVTIKDGFDNVYIFTRNEDGFYTAATDTENPMWTEIFTISVPLEKDISFLDWSDPENLDEPVKKGYEELIDLLNADTSLTPDNTKLTFDENGKLVELLYTYSPWN